jgi:hypothetical protein
MAALLITYVNRISNNKAMCIIYSSYIIYMNVLIIKMTQILSRKQNISNELQA